MSTFADLVEQAKRHHVTFLNARGQVLIELSLFWALLIAIVVPQALVVVVVLALLSLIRIELDGLPLSTGSSAR